MLPKYKLELVKEGEKDNEEKPFYLNENVVLNRNIEYKNKYYSIGTKGNVVNLDYDKKEASVYFENNGVIVPNIPFNYIDKYSNGEKQPKAENPKEPQVMIPQGTEFELMEDDGTLKKGDTGVFAQDYYPPNTFVDAYMNSERVPDFLYSIPFKKIRIIEEAPREEIPEEEILPFVRGETIKLKMPFTYNNSTYPEGLRGEVKRVDYVFKTAYVYFYGDDSGNYPVPFEYLEKFAYTDETPKEVNLDEYINDLNVLLEMEDDESKRLELATYISDLNILKLLD
jgi:hypothetical protein